MSLFSFRGGKKAPIEPRVQAIQQVAVPFGEEMSFPSVTDFEETEDIHLIRQIFGQIKYVMSMYAADFANNKV